MAVRLGSRSLDLLFMLRTRADVGSYFNSWFHWLDATVITAGFIIDVFLTGVFEEVGSLVVVLRLWRVFKVRRDIYRSVSYATSC